MGTVGPSVPKQAQKGLNWGGRDGDSDPWARRAGGGAEARIISAPGGNPGGPRHKQGEQNQEEHRSPGGGVPQGL